MDKPVFVQSSEHFSVKRHTLKIKVIAKKFPIYDVKVNKDYHSLRTRSRALGFVFHFLFQALVFGICYLVSGNALLLVSSIICKRKPPNSILDLIQYFSVYQSFFLNNT